MNTTIFIIVAFILSTICILNLVIQFSEKLRNNVLKYDYFQLITYWTLFAPKPMKYDFYIIYRDQENSGKSNDFCEIEITNKSIIGYIFKSDIKKEMALYKACACILRIKDKNRILNSYYYKYLEKFVKEQNPSIGTKRQFCILKKERTINSSKPELFLSSYISYE